MTVDFESNLRRELQSAELAVTEGEAVSAVGAARMAVARHDARRERFLRGAGVAVVAVLVAGTVLVGAHLARSATRSTAVGEGSGPAQSVVAVRDWPARGDRVPDDGLIARATATAKVALPDTRVLYAGNLSDQSLATAVVLLTRGATTDSVSFVTQKSSSSALQLSGRISIPAGAARAYLGFVDAPRITASIATPQALRSGSINSLSPVAGMLQAPGSSPGWIVTSLSDGQESSAQNPNRVAAGFTSTGLIPGASVWNVYAADQQGKPIVDGQFTATDGVNPTDVAITKTTGRLHVSSSHASSGADGTSGALVGTPLGLIGTITSTGDVDTDLTSAAQRCTFITLQTAYEGAIARGSDGKYTFVPVDSSTPLGFGRLTCRVTLQDGSLVYLSVGRVGDPPLTSNQIAYTEPDAAMGSYLLPPSA